MPTLTIEAAGDRATVDYTSAPVMPGPSNTGVPRGVTLQRHDGDVVITAAGTVIDGWDIYGNVTVKARDVTIRRSIIRGGVPGKQVGIVLCAGDGYSLTIEDSEIVAQNPSYQVDGLRGWNITARRLNIHGVIDPCHFYGTGNVKLEGSWLHDNLHYVNDPGWGGKPSHDDSIQIQSGAGISIVGNRLEGAHNAAIQVTQDGGPVSDLSIRSNWLDGGGCTVNMHDKGKGPFVRVDVTGNTFGTGSAFNCHVIRPPVGDITVAGNTVVDGRAVKINFHK